MTEQAISPLRRRMIEDMSIRKFAAKTQHDDVQRGKDLATLPWSLCSTAEAEDMCRFRLHLTATGAGTPKINATVAALRFFFTVTLDRPDLTKQVFEIRIFARLCEKPHPDAFFAHRRKRQNQ
jgi:hypothetical protein